MPIHVGIIGVGNCAKSLVEAVQYFKYNPSNTTGLAFPVIGGYKPSDIEFVCAFDIDKRKVGKRLGNAIHSGSNCALDLTNSYGNTGPVVERGILGDGVAAHMIADTEKDATRFFVDEQSMCSSSEDLYEKINKVKNKIKEANPDVMLLYLPVGSEVDTKLYVSILLELKVPFVNCIPVFIVSDRKWQEKITEAGICAIGDDMRSQVGASVLSQVLHEMFVSRGATVDFHCQQNSGGNTDFLNMTDKNRLRSKKTSKENVIRAAAGEGECFIHAGPSDYIQYLGDKKVATIRIEARGIAGVPIILDARLEVQDSPNSAGIVIDAIRYLKRATELGVVGPLYGPSAATQKTPPKQLPYAEAYAECKKLAES